jgi:Tol biopolymer transport system component
MIADMRPDGSGRRLLTADACQIDGPHRAAFPDYSADGRTLAFVRDGRLMTMTADGAGALPVPGIAPVAGGRPTLSPDGTQVSYTRVVSNRQTIFRASLDGSGERRLRVGSNPRWSPGGRNLAFITPDRHHTRRQRPHLPPASERDASSRTARRTSATPSSRCRPPAGPRAGSSAPTRSPPRRPSSR